MPQVQVIQPIQQQPKRLRVAAYARVSSDSEYAPTEEFPETFYKEVVSKVILYRDTHIEFKLQNGQIV